MTRLHRWLQLTLGAFAAAAALIGTAQAQPATPHPLRSGHEDLSPRLRALQQDLGLNPAWLWIEDGRRLWNSGQASCASCHGTIEQLKRSAARHPRWHAASQQPRTLADQVQVCRQQRSSEPQARADDEQALALQAALVAAADGQAIEPDRHAEMQRWADRGQRLWQQRMGQVNLACANCHDAAATAGHRLAGSRIPQGHDTGYPLYRLEWQGLGTLERRIRGCLVGVRAEPFDPSGINGREDAKDLKALEIYMRRRSAGLLLQAGSLRP